MKAEVAKEEVKTAVEQAPLQIKESGPTEAELVEEAEAKKAVKNLEEDEGLDNISRIAKAYPIACQKYEDNAKWEGFKTELNSLCSGIGKDWEDKVDADEFECNLTDH